MDSPEDFLSTGSTLVNCGITGNARRGFCKGKYYLVVGDSTSGKTFLCATCLAEACRNKNFDDHNLVYWDIENGTGMMSPKFFGQKLMNRIECDQNNMPTTVEEMYSQIRKQLKRGPFIGIVDSMDALDSEKDLKKIEEWEKAREKGKESKGSYGTGKAAENSKQLGAIVSKLRDTGSILIIISQTRENIGLDAMFNPKVRSGGKALRFYATVELWSSVKKRLTKTRNEKQIQIGIQSSVRLKKNRSTGREVNVEFPIYWSTGIDDIGSCVDYLVEWKHWKKKGKLIIAHELDIEGDRETIIKSIQSNRRTISRVRKIVQSVWKKIEDSLKVDRVIPYE